MALTSLRFVEQFISLPMVGETVDIAGRAYSRQVWDTKLISDLLTRQGVEVEGLTWHGQGFDTLVVGRIGQVEPHPNANKLRLCTVDLGHGRTQRIVCGAPNAREGLFVAVALEGTHLPAINTTIKAATIRGVESRGMLCSRSELGLPVVAALDGDGIWELDVEAQGGCSAALLAERLGDPVFDVLGLRDALLELNVLANRPDLRSHAGVARELAAGFRQRGVSFTWREKDFPAPVSESELVKQVLGSAQVDCGDWKFSVDNELGTSAFFTVIDGVTVRPSPAWLRNLLEGLGQNSINNVVDASNFILLAYGQPSHAFDFDKLARGQSGERKLILRMAREGERFVGLDGKERQLSTADCVVADLEKPQALLGVIGGDESKVDESTKRIVLEFANPFPLAVRHTSRRHNRSTESAVMFEKGIDVVGRWRAATQIMGCIAEWSGGTRYLGSLHSRLLPRSAEARAVVSEEWVNRCLGPAAADKVCVDPSIVAVRSECLPGAWRAYAEARRAGVTVRVPDGAVARVAGVDLLPSDDPRGVKLLSSLGFRCTEGTEGMAVEAPSWRWLDIKEVPDIAEEVLRIADIDRIPAIPLPPAAALVRDDAHFGLFDAVADAAAQLGYFEVAGLHFMRENDLQLLGLSGGEALGRPIRLLNPIIADEPLMQTTLVPDVLRKVARNIAYGTRRGQIFHTCRTYQGLNRAGAAVFSSEPVEGGIEHLAEYSPARGMEFSREKDQSRRPVETPRIAGAVFGERIAKTWQTSAPVVWDLHTVLAHALELCRVAGVVAEVRDMPADHPFAGALHPGRRTVLVASGANGEVTPLGWAGAFHPRALRNFEIEIPCLGFELNLAALMHAAQALQSSGRAKTPVQTRRFPTVSRDFAVLLDERVTGADLDAAVARGLAVGLASLPARAVQMRIFDIFRGKSIPDGKKSVAFNVLLEPTERTLNDAEIQAICKAVIDTVARDTGGELRT